MHWDKRMTGKLLELGLTREQAGTIIGLIAEERQIMFNEGFHKGFNNGYEVAEKKYKEVLKSWGIETTEEKTP